MWCCKLYYMAVLIYIPQSFALTCVRCEETQCVTPQSCKVGYVMDVCNCCPTCAKAENESCGGPWDYNGKCGLGLYCNVSRDVGENLLKTDTEGVCKECETVVYHGCNFIHGICQCGDSCTDSFEFSDRQSCLEQTSGNSVECSGKKCPVDTMISECPADSYRPPPQYSEDGCCRLTQSCKCKDTCPSVPICRHGERLVKVTESSSVPGTCCAEYVCINATSFHCQLDNSTYYHGQAFMLNECQKCMCKDGVVACHKASCNIPSCGWMSFEPGECCPKCQGCVSAATGQHYLNGESWEEDSSCTKCQCVSGQAHCTASACARSCRNPIKISGQCCPLCDEDDTIYELQSTTGKFEPCVDNSQCPSDCIRRVYIEVNDCSVCTCQDDLLMCRDSVGCTKKCSHGYKRDPVAGCYKCRCNRCPKFQCDVICPNGYHTDQYGCNTCQCKEKSPAVDVCFTSEGLSYITGDSWFDGCRQCYCENGIEMCSLISCPTLSCNQPIIRPGDCCPSCPNDISVPQVLNVSVSCLSSDGSSHMLNELWQLDLCTVCLCHQGHALCETERCPPTLCSHPIKRAGKCCPECPGHSEGQLIPWGSSFQKSCTTIFGTNYSHGDIWKVGDCQSCTCQHGHISCFSQVCPTLMCKSTVLRKGQCCPTCAVEQQLDKTCIFSDKLYSHLDTWEHDTSLCTCYHGYVKCEDIECNNCQSSDIPCCKNKFSDGNDWSLSSGLPMIIILSVLLALFVAVVILLTVILIRQRRKRKSQLVAIPKILEMRAMNNARDAFMKKRPKSTNLEFLHATTDNKYNNAISKDKDCFKPLMDATHQGNEYVHC